MAGIIRPLLQLGNSKLGEGIHTWGLPAITSCPGRTATCESACYARSGRYRFQAVQDRLAWNLEQALKPSFVSRMVAEIKKRGCIVLRVHCSGDFLSGEYAAKWLEIMQTCPRPRYYWYSRSWRCEEIRPYLEQMAALKCCKAWYSIDRETGVPDYVPKGVRLAYLQIQEDEQPELVDLYFKVRRLRKHKGRVPLRLVCPAEVPKRGDTTCGSCRRCWSDD